VEEEEEEEENDHDDNEKYSIPNKRQRLARSMR